MDILTNLVILSVIVVSFIAGLKLDNYYHAKASSEMKNALERQFVRLQAKADADDPCKPYFYPEPIPIKKQPISKEFMTELHHTGKAKTAFRKSDLVN